jgi:hypothetical protein
LAKLLKVLQILCSHSQGETVNYADKLGLIAGGAVAAAVLLRKQMQYRQSHGIGTTPQLNLTLASSDVTLASSDVTLASSDGHVCNESV